MLAQRTGCGNDALALGIGRRREDGFEGQFAGFREFDGTGVIGEARRFQKNGVRAGREFESGWRVSVEFAIDVDFSRVRVGSNGEEPETVLGGGRGGG